MPGLVICLHAEGPDEPQPAAQHQPAADRSILALLRQAANEYLFPLLIGAALLIVLTALVLDRGGDAKRREEPRRPVEPVPLPPVAVPATPPPAAVAAGPAEVPALLVVDDSAVARAKLRRLFEGAGFVVTVARDGLEALDALAAGFYSVLVTDLEMPQMSGLELIASVQGSLDTEDLPIIAITGHDELQAHARDYQGLYGIFKKPWNDRDLLKRVESLAVLRQPVPGRSPPRPTAARDEAAAAEPSALQTAPTPAMH